MRRVMDVTTQDNKYSPQIICCKLCISVYKSPKLLPCLHSFCATCLYKYCERNSNQGLAQVCPSCNEPFDIPDQGIASLPNNVVLQRAILSRVDQVDIGSSRQRGKLFDPTNIFDETSHVQESKTDRETDVDRSMLQKMEDILRAEKVPSISQAEKSVNCSLEKYPQHYGTSNFTASETNVKREDDSVPEQQDKVLEQPANVNIDPSDKIYFPSPSTDKEISFQQEHRTMVKSASEFSNFSIESLKFEPQDYEDIAEVFYIEDDTNYNSSSTNNDVIEEQRQRDQIKDELAMFQNEALGIIYSIDYLNKEKDRWNKHKVHLQHRIQNRSTHLQDLIKGLERRFLLQIDTHWQTINIDDVIDKYKTYMHNRLKGILAMNDLGKLLLDHGIRDEIPIFQEMILNRKQSMNGQKLRFEQPYMDFVVPPEEDTAIEGLFGTLNVMTKSESFWEFCPASETVPNSELQSNEPISYSRYLNESISISDRENRNRTRSKITSKCRSPSAEQINPGQCPHRQTRGTHGRRSFSKPETPFDPMCKKSSVFLSNEKGNHFIDTRLKSECTEKAPNISYDKRQNSRHDKGRRHTDGNIRIDKANSSQFSKCTGGQRNRLPPENEPSSQIKDNGRLRQLNDDVQQTRRMLAMCKRQLLEAQSDSNPLSTFSDIQSGSLPASPRERMEQMKSSARRKSFKWKSESRDGSLDGDN